MPAGCIRLRWSNRRLPPLKAYVEPPAYTRRPGAPARDPARIDAWEDSRVTLELEANRPLKHAEVTWPALDPKVKSSSAATSSRVVSIKPEADATRWSAIVVAEALWSVHDQAARRIRPGKQAGIHSPGRGASRRATAPDHRGPG